MNLFGGQVPKTGQEKQYERHNPYIRLFAWNLKK